MGMDESRCASDLPETPRRVRLGMPHLDAAGLSENWLFRYAGELHWEATAARLRARSDAIHNASGDRLYPTFVAVHARYSVPLWDIRENDVAHAHVDVQPCGRACAHGSVQLAIAGKPLHLEMLTTFAVRQGAGHLRMDVPAARLAQSWQVITGTPAIVSAARAARKGEPFDDGFCGQWLARSGEPLDVSHYDPSPYSDYNGAGLLYFASYPTIADTSERRLIHSRLRTRHALRQGALCFDWALATSPVQRAVYYYANLALGDRVQVELCSINADAGGVNTHVRLRRCSDGRVMSDVVTRRVAHEGQELPDVVNLWQRPRHVTEPEAA